jgi:hypothetical protein
LQTLRDSGSNDEGMMPPETVRKLPKAFERVGFGFGGTSRFVR